MKLLSCVWLFATPWTAWSTRLLHSWDFPGKSTGVDCHFLLQEIFPTQGSNPGLSRCRQTLYHLSHQGSLSSTLLVFKKTKKKKWASSPFAMQGSDCRWIFTPEGVYHLGKSLGNMVPSLPPPPALIFFPFHYSSFDLSNPLRSFLNTPLPLPFSSLSSETQLPKFRVQNEWCVTSEVMVHEWLLSVMASCHNLLLCHSTRTHTHSESHPN